MALVQRFLKGLDKIRVEKGMSIVLISHVQITRVIDPLFPEFDRWGLKLHKKTAALVREWLDILFFARHEQFVQEKTGSFGKKTSTVIGTGNRILHSAPSPAYESKSRLSLPDPLPMEWAQVQSAIDKARS